MTWSVTKPVLSDIQQRVLNLYLGRGGEREHSFKEIRALVDRTNPRGIYKDAYSRMWFALREHVFEPWRYTSPVDAIAPYNDVFLSWFTDLVNRVRDSDEDVYDFTGLSPLEAVTLVETQWAERRARRDADEDASRPPCPHCHGTGRIGA